MALVRACLEGNEYAPYGMRFFLALDEEERTGDLYDLAMKRLPKMPHLIANFRYSDIDGGMKEKIARATIGYFLNDMVGKKKSGEIVELLGNAARANEALEMVMSILEKDKSTVKRIAGAALYLWLPESLKNRTLDDIILKIIIDGTETWIYNDAMGSAALGELVSRLSNSGQREFASTVLGNIIEKNPKFSHIWVFAEVITNMAHWTKTRNTEDPMWKKVKEASDVIRENAFETNKEYDKTYVRYISDDTNSEGDYEYYSDGTAKLTLHEAVATALHFSNDTIYAFGGIALGDKQIKELVSLYNIIELYSCGKEKRGAVRADRKAMTGELSLLLQKYGDLSEFAWNPKRQITDEIVADICRLHFLSDDEGKDAIEANLGKFVIFGSINENGPLARFAQCVFSNAGKKEFRDVALLLLECAASLGKLRLCADDLILASAAIKGAPEKSVSVERFAEACTMLLSSGRLENALEFEGKALNSGNLRLSEIVSRMALPAAETRAIPRPAATGGQENAGKGVKPRIKQTIH